MEFAEASIKSQLTAMGISWRGTTQAGHSLGEMDKAGCWISKSPRRSLGEHGRVTSLKDYCAWVEEAVARVGECSEWLHPCGWKLISMVVSIGRCNTI
jgi:hypothetical protein